MQPPDRLYRILILLKLAGLSVLPAVASEIPTTGGGFSVRQGERFVLIGDALAAQLSHFGYLEWRFQTAWPERELTFRNHGCLGGTVSRISPSPPGKLVSLPVLLEATEASTILLFVGGEEATVGDSGLEGFRRDLVSLVSTIGGTDWNPSLPLQLVLVSPLSREKLGAPWPDPGERNGVIEKYTGIVGEVARESGAEFIDLFHPVRRLMAEGPGTPLTIGGFYPNRDGCRVVSAIVAVGLGVAGGWPQDGESLRQRIVEKNRRLFLEWRPIPTRTLREGAAEDLAETFFFPPVSRSLEESLRRADQAIWEAAKERKLREKASEKRTPP